MSGSERNQRDDELLAHLEEVNRRVLGLHEAGGDSADPERLFTELEARTIAICESLEELVDDKARTNTVAPCSLNELVDDACRELVLDAEEPVVVRSRLDPATPPVAIGSAPTRELVLCAFKVVTEQLRSVGDATSELLVTTRGEDQRAALELVVVAALPDEVDSPTWPRLQDLVQEHGGSLGLRRDADRLALVLDLPAEVYA